MTMRKPLVIADGRVQQLQSGDTLNANVAENNTISLVADATLVPGNVVYSTDADHVGKAKADASGTIKVIGIAPAAIANAATGSIQTSGIITLTTTQWDSVLDGGMGGLAYNTAYYLSAATAGNITATAPSTTGQYVKEIGIALSSTELLLTTPPEILL